MADDFLNYAFEYFLKKGYSPAGAAAMAGQAQWESRGNPAAIHDNGTGRGLYGWRLDRRDNLDKAPGNTTIPGQLAFADSELTGQYKDVGDKIRNAKDLTEATNATLGYLRPAGYTPQNPAGSHGYAERYNLSAGLLNQTPIASALAMPPTKQVGPAPGIKEVPAYTPTNDVFAAADRTKDDADLGGHGSSPKLPDKPLDADKMQSAAGKLTGAGLGLLAAGEPPPPPSWIAQAMNAQPQVHRPQMSQMPAGLLSLIPDFEEEKRRRRKFSGLLGD